MNAYQVVVNIAINSSGSGVTQFNTAMSQVKSVAERTARDSASAFSTIFGANFFANLSSDIVNALSRGLRTLYDTAVQSAKDQDSARTRIGALVGDVTKANVKILELQTLARNSVGVLRQSALESYALLKGIGGISEESISKTIVAMGKLKAAFGILDPTQFQRNLIQIFSQSFERQDIKQALGEVPIFEQLLQSAFGTKDQAKLQALKNAGKLTLDSFLSGLSDAIAKDPRIGNITDNLTTKLARGWERISVALAPVGQMILNVLVPAVERAGPVIESLGKTITNNIGTITALTVALTALAVAYAAPELAGGIKALVGGLSGSVFVIQNVIRAMLGLQTAFITTSETLIAATGGWAALLIGIGAVIYAIVSYNQKQVELTQEQKDSLDTTKSQIDMLKGHQAALGGLSEETTALSLRQGELADIYNTLDAASKDRVDHSTAEMGAVKALTAELDRLANAQKILLEAKLVDVVDKTATAYDQMVNATNAANKAQAAYNEVLTHNNVHGLADDTNLLRSEYVKTQAEQERARKTFNDLSSALDHGTGLLGLNTREFIRNKEATGEVRFESSAFKDQLTLTGQQQNIFGAQVQTTTDAIVDQAQALQMVQQELSKIQAGLKLPIEQKILDVVKSGVSAAEAKKQFQEARQGELKGAADDLKRFKEIQKVAKDVFEPDDKPKRGGHHKSQIQSMSDDLKRLRFEVDSFRNLTSRAFAIRFEKEELERTKRDFEKILDLRRELLLPLTSPLPEGADALQQEIRRLTRLKSVKEDILKVTDEQWNAEKDLAVALQTQALPVVDAQTRAMTAYARAVRERANADQQLTADVITASRLRQDRIKDEVGETFRAYQSLRLDLLKENEQIDKDLKKSEVLSKILSGDEKGVTATIEGFINLKPPEPPSDLMKIASSAAEIQKDVAVIASKFGGGQTQSIAGAIAHAPSRRAAEVLQATLAPSRFDAQIAQAANVVAKETGQDANLIATAIKATLFRESSGRPGQVSEKGALGWFQQLPDTARKLGVRNVHDFLDAATGAGRYLVRGFGSGGLMSGGIDEMFGTYFAGEGGGNRGRKTRAYIRDQRYVLNAVLAAQRAKADAKPGDETIKADPALAPSVEVQELIRTNAFRKADADRLASNNNVVIETLRNEGKLKAGLIDFDKEVNYTRSVNALKRRDDARATAVNIKLLEEDITKLEQGDALETERVRQKAREQRLTESKSLSQQLITLEEDYAHYGELSAKRVEVAYKSARNQFYDIDGIIGRTRATIEYLQKLKAGDPQTTRAENARFDESAANAANARQQEIFALQRKLYSNAPLDVATRAEEESQRYQLAWLKAIDAVRDADISAREQMIADQIKLADATVYHADQANAKVSGFLASQKSLSETIGDFKVGVIQSTYSFIDKGLDKITQKLGILGSAIKELLSNLIRLALNKVFQSLFLGGGGATTQTSTGGGGFSIGNLFSGFLTGGGNRAGQTTPQGFSNFNFSAGSGLPYSSGTASPLTGGPSPFAAPSARALFGQGTPNPFSAFSTFLNQTHETTTLVSQSISQGAHEQANNLAGTGASAVAGSVAQKASFAKSIGAMLPALGASLGSTLGGQSIPGQILGGVGGAAAGILGGIATGAINAGTMFGGLFGAGGALSIGSLGAALSATVVLAPLAAALIVGSILLGRNKRRRQEEQLRAQILSDSKSKIQSLIDQVRAGSLDGATALVQANAIRQDYLNQVGQLKDGKTRRIALETVRELDYQINILRREAAVSDQAAERFKLLIPTFATGGNIAYGVSNQGFTMSAERALITKRDDEVVLTRQHLSNLNLSPSHLSAAGVPGYSHYLADRSFAPRGDTSSEPSNYMFAIVADDEAADRLVARARPGTFARKVRLHSRQNSQDDAAAGFLSVALG